MLLQTLAYIFIWFYVRAQPWWVEYQFVQVGTTHHLNKYFSTKNIFSRTCSRPTRVTSRPTCSSTPAPPPSSAPSSSRRAPPTGSRSTQTVANIFPPINIFPLCVFAVIMGTWAVAACATVIFMSLYSSQDFAERLNFKIAPHLEFQIIAVIGIIVNFIFCYVWEVCQLLFRTLRISNSLFADLFS